MTVPTDTHQSTLEQAVARVQDAVRAEHPYVVGGNSNLHIKLNQNESPFDLPEHLKEELLERFRQIPFNRYPAEHPDALAAALAERSGLEPDSVLVGNGSNELAYLLGLSLLRPGVRVVLPRPMFSLYEKIARVYGAAIESVGPRPDLSFDAEAIEQTIRQLQPSLTILASPNNPTGRAMSLQEIESIVVAARGVVLVDEAYFEFNPEVDATSLLTDHPNLVIMRTFSKAFGLAGLRVGYLLGHSRLIGEFRKVRLPFVVDVLAETAAMLLLEHETLVHERVQVLTRERRQIEEELRALSEVEAVPSLANFVIFRTPLEPRELMTRLAEADILVRDMSGYPELRGYLRVNAGAPDENRAFLTALKGALSS